MSAVAADGVSVSAPAPTRAGQGALVGAISMATAGTMAMVGLGAAYLEMRYGNNKDFSKPATYFNNYAAVIIVFGLLLAALAAKLGTVAASIGRRTAGASAFGLAVVIDLGCLNLLWAIGYGLKFGVSNGYYQTTVYAMLAAAGIALLVAAVASMSGAALVFGGHASPSSPYTAAAAAVGQYFAVVAWLVAFAAIFLKK